MENKLLDQFNDIFQEIFDDFPELQFELSFHGPGLMKYISKNIDADMITPPLRYDRVRKMAVDYAKRLEPYLRESNDRLSDIGFQCSYNPNENVRLLNKMTMEYDIVICIRQIKRNESYVKNWKSFRTINEIIEFKNIKYSGPAILTPSDKEDIQNAAQSFFDEFSFYDFKLQEFPNSSMPLIALSSRLMNLMGKDVRQTSVNIRGKNFTRNENDLEDIVSKYVQNHDDNDLLERMEDLGYRYVLTQRYYENGGGGVRVYFKKV